VVADPKARSSDRRAARNQVTPTVVETAPVAAGLKALGGESVPLGMIGARLRARRLAHGISLRQFARDLDVSASFISQLETGKAQPSVATLFAICTALGISSDELFETAAEEGGGSDSRRRTRAGDAGPSRDASSARRATPGAVSARDTRPTRPIGPTSPVVHPSQRRVLVLDSGVTWESLMAYHSERTDFLFVRYDVGGSSTMEGRLIRHVGTEYGFILSGTLEVTLGFESYRLHAGDAISFDSTRPHRLTNVGDVPVEAIWFNLERSDDAR
jgi:transcriptional regulator with XRE-family HTH domain/mannose-6-phosphate isomerase-like protein (cupin superfamily)